MNKDNRDEFDLSDDEHFTNLDNEDREVCGLEPLTDEQRKEILEAIRLRRIELENEKNSHKSTRLP